MGAWYTIGLTLGIGVAAGVLAAGLLARSLLGIGAAALVAAALGALVGIVIGDTPEPIAGLVGGVLGAIGAGQVVRGTLRRGGTDTGTALLLAVVGLALGALALVPALGYLEAAVVPALAARLRRRGVERYAGLRTLAK
jgi:hypothetical protein